MKIQLYADFTCPFSYMGKRRLDEVIAASDEPIEFELKAFQLTPDAPKDKAVRTVDLLAKKFDKTPEETLETTKRLRDQAAQAFNLKYNYDTAQAFNLKYNYDTMIAPNTENAHRLTKWSAQFGKAHDLTERFFAAIFTRGLNLNEEGDILQVIEEAGLDVEAAKQVLHSDAYREEVAADRQQALQQGIRSVPTYIANDKIIPGIQPVETFLSVIHA